MHPKPIYIYERNNKNIQGNIHYYLQYVLYLSCYLCFQSKSSNGEQFQNHLILRIPYMKRLKTVNDKWIHEEPTYQHSLLP